MMNRKGQMFMFTLMMAVVVIILALALSPVVNDFVQDSRNSSTTYGEDPGLDCNNSSISDYTAATCRISDLVPFAFIAILLGFAGALVGARLIIG